ncbi:PEP-CTERM sorting domain-containing protein [Mucisphaera sp.]|uniref:PEP-CTERM sorting domain-containing protein n=1 Tax=Mucisphaera sp. TaxID=2913024 RepID=UPI003D0AB477
MKTQIALAAAFGLTAAGSAQAALFTDTEGTSGLYTELLFGETYVEYGFDYSVAGRLSADIGTAPNGGSQVGILLAANDVVGGSTGGAYLFPNITPGANYAIQFDFWSGVNNVSGTSEHVLMGVNANATDRGPWQASATYADHFGVTTASDISNDYAPYATVAGSNEYLVGQALDENSALVQSAVGVDGRMAEEWVTIRVESFGDDTTLSINGVDLITIAGSDFTSGDVFMGYADYFGSVAGGETANIYDGVSAFDPFNASFGIIDNVVVEVVPEPASAALLGLAGLALTRRR